MDANNLHALLKKAQSTRDPKIVTEAKAQLNCFTDSFSENDRRQEVIDYVENWKTVL